ncbi:hypothetical protein BABINDRAFT_159222 [Babjeviella inositovora NRRL Y-12698]|uniref:Uncharacterized protein n=1 Tax=Babjeviella inositovora NRRL Y-12698 TaxID=984486 RepID=A0A1E3QYK2_9ASCO|nr:uncharacterized protein BABINDRAFT_159222 [Babjeviella inositovora NRRL Y-12698]ODQ82695.1 hypothetical protein BABINDRAFT_159222 [Babjeviella inositovora NRRL Y-12698]
MLLPTTTEFCPASFVDSLRARSFASDVVSTADSFKSWDTCMGNKTCKIIVIVLIVIGALLVLWVVSTLLRCLCCGVACLEACCFCCCRRTTPRGMESLNLAFNNPNMYPTMYQPAAQPAPVYFSQEPAYAPVNKVSYGYVHDGHGSDDDYKEGIMMQSIPARTNSGYRGTERGEDPFNNSHAYNANPYESYDAYDGYLQQHQSQTQRRGENSTYY